MAITDKPYDEYVDRVMSKLTPTLTINYVGRPDLGFPSGRPEFHYALSGQFLSRLLADAWLAGLAYSLDLIEEETKSPLRMRLRDMPKKFEGGGKMQETIIWENCR